MTAQVNGLNQAARNANDGVSLAQTADGALASISDNLQRIRELSVQSANATNSSSDRASLQQEVSQLQSEINRVATQTQFNGTNLLDGTFSAKVFQVGANAGQTITVSSISSARASDLGASYKAAVTGSGTLTALAAGSLTLNGAAIQASVVGSSAGQDANSAYSIAQAINASQGTVQATANAATVTGATPTVGALSAGGILVNGVDIGAVAAGVPPHCRVRPWLRRSTRCRQPPASRHRPPLGRDHADRLGWTQHQHYRHRRRHGCQRPLARVELRHGLAHHELGRLGRQQHRHRRRQRGLRRPDRGHHGFGTVGHGSVLDRHLERQRREHCVSFDRRSAGLDRFEPRFARRDPEPFHLDGRQPAELEPERVGRPQPHPGRRLRR